MDPTTIYTGYLSTINASEVEKRRLADIIELIRSESLGDQIKAIRSASAGESGKLKTRLSAFFPTLLLTGNNALDENSQPTGIVQFDIDCKDNEGCDFATLREEIVTLPETLYAFTSPSGGLKFGLLTDFQKAQNDSLDALKSRYKQAYGLALDYVQASVATSFVADKSAGNLKQSCYLSSDAGAYLNQKCRVFSVNSECAYVPPKLVAEPGYSPIAHGQVAELLSFIPHDLEYGDRLPINGAVLSELGEAGIPLLLSYWTTTNQKKLASDIQELLTRIQQGSFKTNLGALVNKAKENGWTAPTGRRRNSLVPKPIEQPNFEPLLTPEEAETSLKRIIEQFFEDRKSRFVNFSTGAGKTYTLLKVLEDIGPSHNILFLVNTHELAAEIVETSKGIRKENQQKRAFKAKFSEKSLMVHMKGRNALCQNAYVQDAYHVKDTRRSIPIPANQCSKGCPFTAECRYTTQFNNRRENIRIMMFNEYFNEPTRWFNGVDKEGKPSKKKWEPNFIIIDENILCKENDWVETRSSRFSVIAKILDSIKEGKTLDEAILENSTEIDVQAVDNKKPRPIKFVNTDQYLEASKKKAQAKPYSPLFNRLIKFVKSKDASYLNGLRVEGDALVQSVLKTVNSRYSGIPTLYLDATANRSIINRLLPDVEYHSIKVKAKADINIYQLSNKTLTREQLSKEAFLGRIIEGLNNLCSKYNKVGLITYKNIDTIKNFDEYLANELGIKEYAHFGNLRGVNKFNEMDCLIVVGRYCLNPYVIKAYSHAVFGQKSEGERCYLDSPVRLKDGAAAALNSLIYTEAHTRAIYEHFSLSETQQAIGRGRLIYGKPKDIYFLSNEYLGSDIEITSFLNFDDLFPDSLITDDCWASLDERGFVRDVQAELMNHLDLTTAKLKKHRDKITGELVQAGFQLHRVEMKDQWRKARKWGYFVKDKQKLEPFLVSEGYKDIKIGTIQ